MSTDNRQVQEKQTLPFPGHRNSGNEQKENHPFYSLRWNHLCDALPASLLVLTECFIAALERTRLL